MRRGHRTGLFAALFLLAVAFFPLPLSAQADDLARVRAEYDAAVVARIDSLIQAAEADGVPRSLLVEKAVEGAAKGMEAPVVIDGVRTWARELRGAVRILGRGADPAGLAKVAESISHGVDRGVVQVLAGDHPVEYPIMLQAIEDLLHAGVELEAAQGMVAEAAAHGMPGHDVLTISATVRRLVREGRSPIDAADSIRRSLRAGRPVIPPPPPLALS